jgi:LmbE family N-acetylglucosaminyl deacetylase
VSVQEQEQNKVAMVIVAHPDDAEFGTAGTVATWYAMDGMSIMLSVLMLRVEGLMMLPMSGQQQSV